MVTKADYDPSLLPVILGHAAEVIRALSFAGAQLTIIGGLVPPLLVSNVEPELEPHVGTSDLDLCMSVALLNGEVGQYENLQKELERAGFDVLREDSKPVSGRWKKGKVVVEFLCPVPKDGSRKPGELYRPGGAIAGKLSALVLEAGALIDQDSRVVTRSVVTSKGNLAFDFRVAGPLSWLVAKTDALLRRDKAKDAYDIVWLCEAWGQRALAAELARSPLLEQQSVVDAFLKLRQAFDARERVGPTQYAAFNIDVDREGAELRAVGAVSELFKELDRFG